MSNKELNFIRKLAIQIEQQEKEIRKQNKLLKKQKQEVEKETKQFIKPIYHFGRTPFCVNNGHCIRIFT